MAEDKKKNALRKLLSPTPIKVEDVADATVLVKVEEPKQKGTISIVQFVQACGPGAHTTLIAKDRWIITECDRGLNVENIAGTDRWGVPWSSVIWFRPL